MFYQPKILTLIQFTYELDVGPEHGQLLGTAPNFTYLPDPSFHGTDSLIFHAEDSQIAGNEAVITIDVTQVNDPPLADDQEITTFEDSGVAIILTGSDPDEGELTFNITVNPSHGSLSGNPPFLSYVPEADFSGSDSFVFVVNDGLEDSPEGVVSIEVKALNDIPTAENQVLSTPLDNPLDITVAGSDVDGDDLTFSLVSFPNSGTLTGVPPNFTYVPFPSFTGTDFFRFKVSDGISESTAATILVTTTSSEILESDADLDGLPDEWELEHGLDPSKNDSLLDRDLDGLVNYEEFEHRTDPLQRDSDQDGMVDGDEALSGTDPLDHDEYFTIEAVTEERGGFLTKILSWHGERGRLYRVMASQDLETWEELHQVSGEGRLIEFSTDVPHGSAIYFRLHADLQ